MRREAASFAIGVLLLLYGCTAREYKPLPSYCYDEALYTAKLVRCVDAAETLAASKSCRREVDISCGITQTVTVKPVSS